MKKKNALFVLHYSPPIHGASKVGDTIRSSKLLKSNFETRFVKIKSSNSLEEIGTFKLVKIWFLIELFVKISYQLISFRPKVIYYTASPNGFAFYRDLIMSLPIKVYRVIKNKGSVFYHYHAKGIYEFTSASNIARKLTKFFVKNINIIFISEPMKSELDIVKSYKRIIVLKNGVDNTIDESAFNTLLDYRFDNDKTKVLYLSNMIREKGYDTVLELAAIIKKKGINVEFHFAGGWARKEDETYFNDFVITHNLKTVVKYHGLVMGRQKNKLFEESNLFIFPSRYPKEVFPLSILEALSYGLPILTFDIGAVTEIIDDKIGIITNRDLIFQSFTKMKNQYINKEVSLACRNRFLENYTTQCFEKNLVDILTLKNGCSNK